MVPRSSLLALRRCRKPSGFSGLACQGRPAYRRTRPGVEPERQQSSRSSSEHELYTFVLAALALVARDLHPPDLARVGDMGPAVGLSVEPLYLHDPNVPHPLRHQVDLGTDEIGVRERPLALQFVDPYRTFLGESLVRQAFDLADDLGGPLAGEREVHPGAVRAHLAACYFGFEATPDHTREDVQRRMVSHVGEPPPPIHHTLEIPHGIGDGSVSDVYDLSTLAPRVNDHHPDRTDTERSLVGRLASAARVEGSPVQNRLTAF